MSAQTSTAILPPLSPGIGLVVAGLLLATLFWLSLPDDLLWQRVLEDAGHGPVFGGLAIVLLWLQSPRADQRVRAVSQYRQAFLVAVIAGIATELLQGFLPARNVSPRDVLHDAAGAALGLALFWVLERWLARREGSSRVAMHGAIVTALVLATSLVLAWQPLQCARAYAERARGWPTLLPLDSVAEAAFVRFHAAVASRGLLPAAYARAGDPESMRLEYVAGVRPGVQLLEPVADWRDYQQLVIDVTNPTPQPLRVVLRILDAGHDWTHEDRFNQLLVLPARKRVEVRIALEAVAASPRGRRMDMSAIANVMLVTRKPREAGEFYITRVWLE